MPVVRMGLSVGFVWGTLRNEKKGVYLLAKENRVLSRTITQWEAYGRAGLKPGICTTSNLKVDSNQEIIVYAIRGHVIENIVKDPRIWK